VAQSLTGTVLVSTLNTDSGDERASGGLDTAIPTADGEAA